MRLEITLTPEINDFSVNVNYNYPLQSAIYKILSRGSSEISKWLHDKGYASRTGKPMKLFVFSRLITRKTVLKNEKIYGSGAVKLYFSTPIDDKILSPFVKGLFVDNSINIGGNGALSKFYISGVQILKPPEFTDKAYYRTLSPITVSTMREVDGKVKTYYYRLGDEGLESALAENLRNKYQIVCGEEYDGEVKVRFDKSYQTGRGDRQLHKLITLKAGSRAETKVKAIVCPLEIEASAKMQSVAYNCGAGEKSSMGFGMLAPTD